MSNASAHLLALGTLAALMLSLQGCSESPPSEVEACNGSARNCEIPLDELVFAATHNSMANAEDGWVAPNHQSGISAQLEGGIRGFLIDTYEFEGELVLCHGFCELGSVPLAEVLGHVADFLDANPGEFLIFVIQDAITPEQTASAFEAAGLVSKVYSHEPGGGWPSLGELLSRGQQLLVTAEAMGPPPGWYHHAWSLFQDTHYAFESVDEIHCGPNRGEPDNPLFLMNHWLGTSLGLPDEEGAELANAASTLRAQVDRCQMERGLRPTLIAVDFWESGDVVDFVEEQNALWSGGG